MTAEGKTRLLVISNRLPITIKKNEENSETPWNYTLSSGGLVSALSGLKKLMSFIWIGWPGFEVEPEHRQRLTDELMEMHSCLPVFLSNEIIDLYYNGFSNSTLWPLFHYLPGEIDFSEAQWDGYYRANAAFATTIKEIVKEGDMIWVQDYHLMLLPALLRELLTDIPNVRIGFFLHTPFPSSEVYRVLPVRKQILLGVLQCDLIGFHTYDYARHFLSSCARILGISTMPNGIDYDGRFVNVGTFPIGIDPDKFIAELESPDVQAKIKELEERFVGKKLMVGVDRLDYIKGVPHKLHAFDQFLTRYPEFQGKVALLQVAVPTRTEVEEYKNLRTSVNELVGRINGKFGTFDFTPVQYLYRSVSFEDLVALYRVADVCVVTSTRDGMNLVSYEFVATQKEKSGVLILSEFAGAAQSMDGAIIVNPWSIDDLVDAYHEALSMPAATAARHHEKLLKYVTKHTASYWGQSFVSEMQNIAQSSGEVKRFWRLPTGELLNAFRSSSRTKLILISIDDFFNAKLSFKYYKEGRGMAKLIEAVSQVSLIPNTVVYVFSSAGRSSMQGTFQHGNVGLISENGCFLLHPMQLRVQLSTLGNIMQNDWIEMADFGDEAWRDRVSTVLKFYTEHTPGAVLEEREKILVWNFGECEREFGQWQANELQANLEKLLSHAPISISLGTNSLEIRPSLIDKTVAMRRILADLEKLQMKVDFILCVNHAPNDDKLFAFLNNCDNLQHCTKFSVSIGKRRCATQYYLPAMTDLLPILTSLTPK